MLNLTGLMLMSAIIVSCVGLNAAQYDACSSLPADPSRNFLFICYKSPTLVVCRVRCQPGYYMAGVAVNQISCQNGVWQPTLENTKCVKECPFGVPLYSCFESPCKRAICPRFPDAKCTDNYCGGCNAIFTNRNGIIIQREACFQKGKR